MGITIHFEGTLKGEALLSEVIATAERYCNLRGWPYAPIDKAEATLHRVRDEEDWDYHGPVRGIEITPHEECEPLRLEFDRDLYVQDFTKTQFAPIEVHVEIVELLKQLEPSFQHLSVNDESEYYDSGDRRLLEEHRSRFCEVFQDYLSRPGNKGPVRLESGRIVDLLSNE